MNDRKILLDFGEDWVEYYKGEIITIKGDKVNHWNIRDLPECAKCYVYIREAYSINETTAGAIITTAMEYLDAENML